MTEDDNIQKATTLEGFIGAVNEYFKFNLIPTSFSTDIPFSSTWEKAISVVKGAITRIVNNKQKAFTTYSAYSSPLVDLPFTFAQIINREYDLTLIPLASTSDLVSQQGQSLIIVAKVDEAYHARILNEEGDLLSNHKPSLFLPNNELKEQLDTLFQSSTIGMAINLNADQKIELAQKVATAMGYTLKIQFRAELTVETESLDSS
jgi:hypothetical protein